ncbi:MAG: peptide ABC transporter permease, partial [Candidatus Rokuibacteriota bacterium]
MTTLRRYLAERLAGAVVTLLGVSVIVFLMVRVLPGDPARVIAGVLASEEEVGRLRSQLELDRPLPVQYGSFLLRLARGNLGVSARTSEPVTRELLGRLPRTVELAVVSSAIATAIGIAAGVAAAACPYSIFDYLLSMATLS